MPQVLQITASQYEALAQRARADHARRLLAELRADPRVAAQARGLDERWALDLAASARQVGVVEEDDVAEFAVLRLLAPPALWDSRAAREVLESGRDGALKVFQLRHALAGTQLRG